MRHIAKGAEPRALTEYRRQPGAHYDGDSGFGEVKKAIRAALVDEQRGLCCYCNDRIVEAEGGMRIEHRVPQSADRSRDLDWKNLLGACRGNEGPGPTHCDVSKGDQSIAFDPTLRAHTDTVGFRADQVTSSHAAFQHEFDDVLRINTELLRGNRRRALNRYIAARIGDKSGPIQRQRFERCLQALESAPRMESYGSYLAWWLRGEINRRGG